MAKNKPKTKPQKANKVVEVSKKLTKVTEDVIIKLPV
jgi:hypothetical protein